MVSNQAYISFFVRNTVLVAPGLTLWPGRLSYGGWTSEGAFPFHRVPGPPRTGRSLHLIWHWTLDPRPLFMPNRPVGCAILDYFGAN